MTAKHSTKEPGRRHALDGVKRRGFFAHLISPTLVALLALPSCFVTSAAFAQPALTGDGNAITGGSQLGDSAKGLLNIGAKQNIASKVPGLSATELLRGNGSRIGYTLQHGNVLPDTISVRVSGMLLKLNRDYWLDADNGALYFAQAVRPSDSVRVYYRYL